jgi:acetyl-CoA carboxylase biotin carboxyl carrier protein
MPPRGKSKTSPSPSSSPAKRSATRSHDEASIVDTVRGLAEILAEHGLSEVIVDMADATLTLRRGLTSAPIGSAVPIAPPSLPAMQVASVSAAAPATAAKEPAAVDDKAHVVTSPFVGSFYRKPNPDSASYVQLNDKVAKGQVLCIVEAMKLMNEIEADVAGTIIAVLVEDGAGVEYGQPLFKIST